MKPVKFKGTNIVFAEDQPQYLPLPAYRDDKGEVTVCYRLTIWERFIVLFRGNMWFQILTFFNPLQPQKLSIRCPFQGGPGK